MEVVPNVEYQQNVSKQTESDADEFLFNQLRKRHDILKFGSLSAIFHILMRIHVDGLYVKYEW